MCKESVSKIRTSSFVKFAILKAIKDVEPMCLAWHWLILFSTKRVAWGGIEPPTLRLWIARSNHLSYHAILFFKFGIDPPTSRTGALTIWATTPYFQIAEIFRFPSPENLDFLANHPKKECKYKSFSPKTPDSVFFLLGGPCLREKSVSNYSSQDTDCQP